MKRARQAGDGGGAAPTKRIKLEDSSNMFDQLNQYANEWEEDQDYHEAMDRQQEQEQAMKLLAQQRLADAEQRRQVKDEQPKPHNPEMKAERP